MTFTVILMMHSFIELCSISFVYNHTTVGMDFSYLICDRELTDLI